MAEGEEGEEEGKTTLFRLQLTPRKDFTSKISLGVKILNINLGFFLVKKASFSDSVLFAALQC